MDLFSSVHFILKTSGLLGSLVGDRKHLTESEDHFLFICFLCHIILDRIVCQTHFWALVTLAMLFRSERRSMPYSLESWKQCLMVVLSFVVSGTV